MNPMEIELLKSDKKILVCIPAHNEAFYIESVVKRAMKYASEVIVVDDGSTDDTRDKALGAGAIVIHNDHNRGYGYSVRKLFQIACKKNADYMVTLDGDGQHDPDQIPIVLEPIVNSEADIVIGSRFIGEKNDNKLPAYRSIGIKTITRLTQIVSYSGLTDAQSGLRAYNNRALSSISLYEDGMSVSTEILLRAKESDLNVKEVPITTDYSVKDPSSQNPVIHGVGVLSSVVQVISLHHPMLFYGLPGIILLCIAAYYLNGALEMYSATRYISTNTILVSIGSAVIGVILLATGALIYTIKALLRGKIK